MISTEDESANMSEVATDLHSKKKMSELRVKKSSSISKIHFHTKSF